MDQSLFSVPPDSRGPGGTCAPSAASVQRGWNDGFHLGALADALLCPRVSFVPQPPPSHGENTLFHYREPARISHARIGFGTVAIGNWQPHRIGVHVLLRSGGRCRVNGLPVAAGDMLLFGEECEYLLVQDPRQEWLALSLSRRELEAWGVNIEPGQMWCSSANRVARCAALESLLPEFAHNTKARTARRTRHHQARLTQIRHWVLRAAASFPSDFKGMTLGCVDRRRLRLVHRGVREANKLTPEPGLIRNVCERLEIGERKLEVAFSAALGMSPLRFLTLQRLVRVRADLQSSTDALPVTEAALNHGFTHLSRFSEFYRRAFGELPSDTIRARNLAVRRGQA